MIWASLLAMALLLVLGCATAQYEYGHPLDPTKASLIHKVMTKAQAIELLGHPYATEFLEPSLGSPERAGMVREIMTYYYSKGQKKTQYTAWGQSHTQETGTGQQLFVLLEHGIVEKYEYTEQTQ